jgi:hypothetical protein
MTHTAARSLAIVAALTVLLSMAAAARAPSPGEAARTFLATTFNLTSGDLAQIDAGHVIVRTLEAADKREVATFGVVRIPMTPAFYVEQLADIARFKRDEAVLQIGTFTNPPQLRDVTTLSLDEADIRNLRDCRVGSCGVQLSREAIGRFRRDVDWRRTDAAGQANDLMRRILVEYVSDYLRTGAAASMLYADQHEPLDLAREFVSLADSNPGSWHRFPGLRRHLFDYPSGDGSGATDLVYWSKEKVGRRGVVSVTHVAIARTAGDSPADYAIASKHIYGTHYFDASLGLTILIPDPSASSPATYLAYLNRSRVDVFGGMFGGIARKVVTAKARSTVADQLARMQRTLERQFVARSP